MGEYDFIFIGAGVAGLAAGMYGGRLGMKTLVLGASHGSEMPIGGTITTTKTMENYPGFKCISGRELAIKIKEHAESYDAVEIKQEKVEKVEKKGEKFIVKTDKNEYNAKSVLFATGTKWKELEIPGAAEFKNRGVAFCALCDAPLFKDKVVAVIGGSDTAVKDALILAEYAKKVYIIYRRDKLRSEPASLERIVKNKKIEVVYNTNVVAIEGGDVVEGVKLDKKYKGKDGLTVNGVFVAIGHVALSDLAKELGVNLNEKGEIMIDHKTSETNVDGVFGAGDVADKPFKQAITGVAEGCTAAHSAFEYINQKS